MRRSAHHRGAGNRLRRWIAAGLGLVIAVAAITLAVLGSLSRTSRTDVRLASGSLVPGSPTGRSGSPGTRTPAGPPGPGKTRVAPSAPAVDSLRAALARQFGIPGHQSGAAVFDLTAGEQLYALRDQAKRAPASVEKLYTTVALLRVMGPGARLHTDVLGSGRLSHGVWHGDLYLRGGGDPTFGESGFQHLYEHGYGPTAAQLVSQLQHAGVRRVTGRVYADESLFDRRRGGLITNYAPDTPDFGGQLSALTYDHGSGTTKLSPAQFAVKQLALIMRGSGIEVRWNKHTAVTPDRARVLASVSSPPLSVMTRLMDVPSDDLFAEMFTKQLGVLFGGEGTIAAGARVIADTIASSYGLHPTILDGSGLSRDNRSSPLEIVDLLHGVWRTAVGGELAASMATVGVEGTVRGIGVKTPAQGRCIAKTGTLNYVTNLAGYCHSRGGHLLAFALLIDGPANWEAVALESKMIAAIARY
jgi:D-alanyl-D-alanine carboxypeptidase/D-alanyl-D-alanine-endopeptidase (penicillin-binding protein 4)